VAWSLFGPVAPSKKVAEGTRHAGIGITISALRLGSSMKSIRPLSESRLHQNAGFLDHAARARSSSPAFPSSLFIGNRKLWFRFSRLGTGDADRITGKPDFGTRPTCSHLDLERNQQAWASGTTVRSGPSIGTVTLAAYSHQGWRIAARCGCISRCRPAIRAA